MVDGIISSVGGVGGISEDNITYYSGSDDIYNVDMSGEGYFVICGAGTGSANQGVYITHTITSVNLNGFSWALAAALYKFKSTGNVMVLTEIVGSGNYSFTVADITKVQFSAGRYSDGIFLVVIKN